MPRIFTSLAACAFAFALAFALAPSLHAQGLPSEARLGYPLGVGDLVRVSVYQQADMATETRVSERGTITVPLIGPVAVQGLTAVQIEGAIASLLRSKGQVRDPQVTVTVLKFNSRQVSVLGLVSRPGRYALEEGQYRLTDVLSLAGGIVAEGADSVTLVRTSPAGQTQRLEIDVPTLFKAGDFSNNPVMAGGDSVYVARAPVFYIYGEVNKPGAFRLDKDMTVMQALSVGGGLTQRGTERSVQIRRRNGRGAYDLLGGGLNERLQPDDVVFVRESVF
jgi:polysaccharide export outer membrane protein